MITSPKWTLPSLTENPDFLTVSMSKSFESREADSVVYRSAISDRMTSERPIGEAVRQAAFVVAVALACGLLAYGSIALTKGTERFAAIWATNAIVVAIMMRRPDDPIAKWSIPVWIANAAANAGHGFGLWQSVIFASANLAEITAAVALLRAIGCKSPDFAKVRDLVRFIVVAGLIAPVLAASVSMLAVSSVDTSTMAINFLRWWATDALRSLSSARMVTSPVSLRSSSTSPIESRCTTR